MTEAEKHLMSAVMYLWSRHVVKGRKTHSQVYKADEGDYNAIRILENFYVLAQILGW